MRIEKCCSGLVVIGIILFLSTSALAHKVNVFAYSEGDTIFTESYFPDGRKVQGGKIEVYDNTGTKLLEGVTDDKGVFNFKTPKKDDLKIVLIATMGHKNSFLLRSDEIEAVADKGAGTTTTVAPAQQDVTQEETAPAVAQTPSSSKKPGRHVEPPKESHTLAIITGLGFIFGLTSLIMHFSKKNDSG